MFIPPQILDCMAESCEYGGCSANLTGLDAQIEVLNLDCVSAAIRHKGAICDCALLWTNKNIFAVIELKGGQNPVIKKLVRQIQGDLNAIAGLVSDQQVEAFYPILLYHGKRDPTASLRGMNVKFRNTSKRPISLKCGERIAPTIVKLENLRTAQGSGRKR